jgi:hypothetical protein
MATEIKNDASHIKPEGTQGALTLAGTAVTWDGTGDADADWQYVQYQVLATSGAYISYDGTAAASGDFEVANRFSATVSRATFLTTSFLDISEDGTVVYQGFVA